MTYFPPKALWIQTESIEDSQTTSRSIMESGSRYPMTQSRAEIDGKLRWLTQPSLIKKWGSCWLTGRHWEFMIKIILLMFQSISRSEPIMNIQFTFDYCACFIVYVYFKEKTILLFSRITFWFMLFNQPAAKRNYFCVIYNRFTTVDH